MKILVVSDLHFEFTSDGGRSLVADFEKDVDVLVAAGDIAVGEGIPEALRLLSQNYKHVVYVPGNHEYYGSTRSRVRTLIHKACKENDNLYWITGNAKRIDDQRFIGDTLWFPKHPTAPKHNMNDFRLIKDFEEWVYEENRQTVEMLGAHVCSQDIVVTHYLPSYQSVADKYRGSELNAFFVCDMEHVIRKEQPKLWIHGHTHTSCDYTIEHENGNKTRVVCNPFGYAWHEENPKFDYGKIIEI
jgi:Icc-related predicted phosphoesterase